MSDETPIHDDAAAAVGPYGFNLIGHLTANIGLGVIARNIARLLSQRNYAFTIYNVEAGFDRDARETFVAAPTAERLDDLPHTINIVVLAGAYLIRFLSEESQYFDREDRINVAVNFWELPTLPPRWIPALDKLDAVIAMSDFIAASHSVGLSGPAVIAGRTPIELSRDICADRQRFGIPPEAVAFATSFETHSDPIRKNPAAVIRAFRNIAETEPDAWLIVKVNNADNSDGWDRPFLTELMGLISGHPRILLIRRAMTYDEVLSLYAACDVYVSLHRAEGLGLAMAEAMALGKPVIATGWSGNLTFMTHLNSCLVRYRLVRVQAKTGSYRVSELDESTVWAEPLQEDAEAWMRLLCRDAGLRERVGAMAAASMARYNADANNARFLDEVRAMADQHKRLRLRRVEHQAGLPSEVFSSNRLAQIQALEKELSWIKSRPSFRLIESSKQVVRKLRSLGSAP